jgi:hypothetical protein
LIGHDGGSRIIPRCVAISKGEVNGMASGNLKLGRAGYFLVAVAIVFFVVALIFLAPQSNDPAEVMRIAGGASGVAGGIGVVLIIVDILRRLKAR